jgi:rare lipoprotein A
MLNIKGIKAISAPFAALITAAGLAFISPLTLSAEQSSRQEFVLHQHAKSAPKHKAHRLVHKQVGEASIYAHKFAYKTMANGKKMDPYDDNAASKTLPLGTRAKVTNLETGQSTLVTIEDRGPYVKGRIVDLPLAKAEEIGITREQGVAKVEVVPVDVPSSDRT